MTAEEILDSYRNKNDWYIADKDIKKAMKEYTTLKCKELLEIVAEKVKKKEVKIPSGLKIITTEIDKDSILNAVDFKEFII